MLKCWGSEEPHYYKNCLHKARKKQLAYTKEEFMVREVARSMRRINAPPDDDQAEYQPTMIECEGMIAKKHVSVFCYPCASLRYVSPKVVEKHLQ